MRPLGRVTNATLDVLRALRALGPMAWGLQIVKVTGRPPGTVYPVLERLERAGWVTSAWEADDSRPGPRRRLYQFTQEGNAAAVDLLTQHAVEVAQERESLSRVEGSPA